MPSLLDLYPRPAIFLHLEVRVLAAKPPNPERKILPPPAGEGVGGGDHSFSNSTRLERTTFCSFLVGWALTGLHPDCRVCPPPGMWRASVDALPTREETVRPPWGREKGYRGGLHRSLYEQRAYNRQSLPKPPNMQRYQAHPITCLQVP